VTDKKEIQISENLLRKAQSSHSCRLYLLNSTFWQFFRYCLVGGANTVIDLLIFNLLVWCFPTNNVLGLVGYNSIGYTCGAVSSLLLNKYWTFRRKQGMTRRELVRFVICLLLEIIYSNGLVWLAGRALRPLISNAILWANASKFVAVAIGAIITYIFMRCWVFAHESQDQPQKEQTLFMTNTLKNIQAKPEYGAEQRVQERSSIWHRVALGGIILISIIMNFFQLGQPGFTSYYPAAVRSMMDNWHNFFFASYDPGGFVTVDKPPVGFWLEVASAKLFGLTPFSVLLPQALAGVLSVILLYYLVRRHFGVMAGLLASLALAVSPISVVTARFQTIDSTLALVLLLGAWAIFRAVETGRLRWLLLSAAIVGIGFNVKMLEAYLVVPAFGLLYLLTGPRGVWKRIGHLILAGIVLLAVSLSWAVAVDMTPPSQRPYVGSSQDNSEINLAFGYNGLNRLLGQQFGGGSRPNTPGQSNTSGSNRGAATAGTPPQAGAYGNAAHAQQQQQPLFGGNFGTGTPGPLRIFTGSLGGQIAWLLPLAMLGAVALIKKRRPHLQKDQQQRQSLVLWGAWLLTMGIFFSVSARFQPYYMTVMAPALCALFGIGLVVMWQDYRQSPNDWRSWLLPLAFIATAAEQVYILTSYPTWGQWLIPLIVVLCALAAGILLLVRIIPRMRAKASSMRIIMPVLSAGILTLLVAPTVWAIIPIAQKSAQALAGPSQTTRGFGGGNFRGGNWNESSAADPTLIHYLEVNQGHAKFLVATLNSMTADGIILATNEPVMAMGGFMGGDQILTTSQLATLVANGTVRFFLINVPQQSTRQQNGDFSNRFGNFGSRAGGFGGFGGFGGGFGNGQSNLTTWVTQHCSTVPAKQWQSTSTSSSTGTGFGMRGANQLYDCATVH
jgi:4-amino-4-deoxy-L-arabinose transferase-like glycosyltransferase/putative flippase GtrA